MPSEKKERESLFSDARLKVAGFALRHPSRFSYVVAELLRPLTLCEKARNSWFHVRHWNDPEAWRDLLGDRGLDDSCT